MEWKAEDSNADPEMEIQTGGTRIVILQEDEEYYFSMQTTSKKAKEETTWSGELVKWLGRLQDMISEHLHGSSGMQVTTMHKRGEQIFRGHPNLRGKVWRDWVWVDYGNASFPCNIWCFVDIPELPQQHKLQYGGIWLEKGMFAVVEAATMDKEPRSL